MTTRCGRTSSGSSGDVLRADARRNRERILDAAREVFIDAGIDAPLDEVARRAGVGIATLYRRFPTRDELIQAVVLDVLARSVNEAQAAGREETDPFQALARYMHRMIDLRISALFPILLDRVALDTDDVRRAREESAELVESLISAAQSSGSLRPDAAFADVGLMLGRLSRSLPGAFADELNARLAHRHLDIVLDGLRADARPRPTVLPGPALDRKELRELGGGTGRMHADGPARRPLAG
jgi:AcrR family transcriptional regulator